MHKVVAEEINNLIAKIIHQIRNSNIDLFELCQKLHLPEELFVECINIPKNNISLYLEILNAMEEMEAK